MIGSPERQLPSAPHRPGRELTLRVVGTEHDGRILRIRSPKCTIGSAAGCTLRLNAPGIQDVHCLVLRGSSGLVVRTWSADTRLNGHTIIDSPLLPGDRLAVGPVELEILDNASAEEIAAALNETAVQTAAEAARLQEIERAAQAALKAQDSLTQRLLEREQHVARLSTQLAEAEQLTEQLKREASQAATLASPSASSPELVHAQQQLEQVASELAAARAAFEAQRNAWEAERTALTEAVAQASEQLEQHKSQAARDQARLAADLERATASAASSVEKLRELREMEVALTHWRERADEQHARINELEKLLQQRQEELASKAGDSHKLRAELEAAARELDAETERLLEREQALEQKLVAWEGEQAKIVAEITEQRSQLALQSTELEQQRLSAGDDERLSLERARVELSTQATELAEQRSQLALQATELESRLNACEEQRVALERQREELATQAAELTEQRSQIAAQASEFERRLSEVEDQRLVLEREREELAAQAAELAQQREALLQQSADFEEQRQRLALDRESLEQQRAALLAEQQSLTEEREASLQQPANVSSDEDYEYSPHQEPAPTVAAEEKPAFQAQSASDVIAKLSASGLWKDEVSEELVEPAGPEPAWKSLVAEEPVQPPAPIAAAEEEDSIEAYMQRLLQRVSGDSAAPSRSMVEKYSAPKAASPRISQPEQAPVANVVAPPPEEPFDFATYTPRTAPELTANLAAMRELANTSARTAIDHSSKRQQVRYASNKIYMSLGAIGTAVALGWLSMRTHSVLSYYAAVSAGAASLLWGIHAGYLWMKARRQHSSVTESNEVKPSN